MTKSIICQNGLERKINDLQQKEIVLSLLSDLRKRRQVAKMLDKPGNSQLVQETILLRGSTKTYNEVAGKQAQVQEVIAPFCGLGK